MHKSERREKKARREELNHGERRIKEKFKVEKAVLFNPSLCEEQRQAVDSIYENEITILLGHAGSGKTFCACAAALKMLLDGKIDNIILCKPMISTEKSIGSLPGDVNDKITSFYISLYDNFTKLYPKAHIDAFFAEGKIQMIPMQFLRGVSIDERSILLVDETQNINPPQLKLIMTRIGVGSHIVFTGDTDQIDLPDPRTSGLSKIAGFNIQGLKTIVLKEEHRSKIVINILEEFKKIGY